MTARILHVSDLHIGRRDAQEPYAALQELAARVQPNVLLATGDLAHRGRRTELERAREVLESVGAPFIAVPGNHDIPYSFPARFSRPFAEWERALGTTEPVHASPGLLVVGLNSVRPWRQQGGALSDSSLARTAARLREAPEGALRVVALHHHLAAPPWRAARKRPLRSRGDVLTLLTAAGVELVAGGHVHQASIAALPEFQSVQTGHQRSLVLVTAPGLGRPRPQRQGEAQGAIVYESDETTLTVITFAWDGTSFAEVGRRSFPRG